MGPGLITGPEFLLNEAKPSVTKIARTAAPLLVVYGNLSFSDRMPTLKNRRLIVTSMRSNAFLNFAQF